MFTFTFLFRLKQRWPLYKCTCAHTHAHAHTRTHALRHARQAAAFCPSPPSLGPPSRCPGSLLPRSVSALPLQDALSWRGPQRLSRPWHPPPYARKLDLPFKKRCAGLPPRPTPLTLRHWSPFLQTAVSTRCQGKVGRRPAKESEKGAGRLRSQPRHRGAGWLAMCRHMRLPSPLKWKQG